MRDRRTQAVPLSSHKRRSALLCSWFLTTSTPRINCCDRAVSQRRLLSALARRDLSDEYVEHKLSLLWTLILPIFSVVVYVFVQRYFRPGYRRRRARTDAVVFLMAHRALDGTDADDGSRNDLHRQQRQHRSPDGVELLQLTWQPDCLPSVVSLLAMIAYAGWITRGTFFLSMPWGIPVLLLISITTFAGLALMLAALQVFLRDTKEFVGMFVSIGFFLHPILYLPNVSRSGAWFSVCQSISQLIFCWHDIMFFGAITRPSAWLAATLFAALVFVIEARLFMGSKPHFGDFV